MFTILYVCPTHICTDIDCVFTQFYADDMMMLSGVTSREVEDVEKKSLAHKMYVYCICIYNMLCSQRN